MLKEKNKVIFIFGIVSTLMATVAFTDKKIFAGVIALLQTALFVFSWLIGKHIIEEKRKCIRTLAIVMAFLLFIPYFGFYNSETNRGTKFNWSDIELSELLPEPPSLVGEIHSNSKKGLLIDIYKTSKKQYNEYVSTCKEKGFNIDEKLMDNSYSAYNQSGYKVG